jgi:hypothetical protein
VLTAKHPLGPWSNVTSALDPGEERLFLSAFPMKLETGSGQSLGKLQKWRPIQDARWSPRRRASRWGPGRSATQSRKLNRITYAAPPPPLNGSQNLKLCELAMRSHVPLIPCGKLMEELMEELNLGSVMLWRVIILDLQR